MGITYWSNCIGCVQPILIKTFSNIQKKMFLQSVYNDIYKEKY